MEQPSIRQLMTCARIVEGSLFILKVYAEALRMSRTKMSVALRNGVAANNCVISLIGCGNVIGNQGNGASNKMRRWLKKGVVINMR